MFSNQEFKRSICSDAKATFESFPTNAHHAERLSVFASRKRRSTSRSCGFQPQSKMYGGWKPPLQKMTTSERNGYFGLRRSLAGVLGEAVSSPVRSPKPEEHCLTQGVQAVAQSANEQVLPQRNMSSPCWSSFPVLPLPLKINKPLIHVCADQLNSQPTTDVNTFIPGN